MKVLCVKGTKRLVKGSVYDVKSLTNKNNSNTTWFRPNISILGPDNSFLGNFVVSNFTQLDGSKIPEINWVSNITTQDLFKSVDAENLKKGDIVVYRGGNNSKTYNNNQKYKINDIKITSRTVNTMSYQTGQNVARVYKDKYIKIEGSNRWVKEWNFRLPSIQETRTLSLNVLFDENKEELAVNKNKRKIDHFTGVEKDSILVKILFESMNDKYRNNMTILEWGINKIGNKYSLTKDDFKHLLSKKLEDIVKYLE